MGDRLSAANSLPRTARAIDPKHGGQRQHSRMDAHESLSKPRDTKYRIFWVGCNHSLTRLPTCLASLANENFGKALRKMLQAPLASAFTRVPSCDWYSPRLTRLPQNTSGFFRPEPDFFGNLSPSTKLVSLV